jgi:hypothetical protein
MEKNEKGQLVKQGFALDSAEVNDFALGFDILPAKKPGLETVPKAIDPTTIVEAMYLLREFIGEYGGEAIAFDLRGRALFVIFLDANNAGRILFQAYKKILQLNSEIPSQ